MRGGHTNTISSMAGTPSRPSRSTTTIAVTLGLLVAVAPRGWLTVITDVTWEQGIISMAGLAGAGLAAGLPWALTDGNPLARRGYVWTILFLVTGALYVISVAPFYLVAAFCAAFVGMLDIWLARAHLASTGSRMRPADHFRPPMPTTRRDRSL
jgi:hypothetical protein